MTTHTKKDPHAQTHLEAAYDIELAREHADLRVGNNITTHAGYDEDLSLSYLSDPSRYLFSHPLP